VAVAGRTVHDVRCLVGEDNTSLLLGQAFLRRFKSWTVDNARHVLVLGEPAV
jgi:predicted aspartyl protease